MPFMLEALRANKGDSLILHYGTDSSPRLAVIDGGTARTYKPALKPRLTEIAQERGLAPGQALPIDLLMVSHIDDDHMHGILELTEELVEAQAQHAPLAYRVRRVWHNSFDDILDTQPSELQAAITANFGPASTADMALARSPHLSRDAAMILVSLGQGRQLRDDINVLNLALNPPFDRLVMQDDANPSAFLPIDETLQLTVIGPRKNELRELQEAHDAWLKKNNKARTSPESALAAFSDRSVPNLSSIVVHAAHGNKSMLLTGDARGDNILLGLRDAGLLGASEPYVTDVLKVPHHGSDNNVTKEFFSDVQATHYVFSGNGQHGNPERATFKMLFDSLSERPGTSPIELYLTYPVDEIDDTRHEEWDREHMKGRKTRAWRHEKDSLAAFFDSISDANVPFKLSAGGSIRITP